MKKLLLIALLAIPAYPQKVEVDQSFIDSSAKAFAEVIALRKLDQAQQSEIEAWKAANTAKESEIATKNLLIEAQSKQIETLIKLKCNKSSFLIFIYRSKKCY